MTLLDAAAPLAVCVAFAAMLAGLVARGRVRHCWALPVYVAGVLATDMLMFGWPHRYYVASFYTVKQAWLDVVKLLLAVELAYRTFHAFPGALARARMVLAVVLAVTALALIGFPAGLTHEQMVTRYAPRIQMGTAWVLTATALLVTWYRLPVRPLHRAVAFGLTAYLFVFTTTWGLVPAQALNAWRAFLNPLAAWSYVLMAAWWAVVAWRKDEKLAVSERTVRLMGLKEAA
jgi:hypothetical protein